ncbi:MAG: cysteine desulfurase family protein [Halothece sp. Uz-M2-17]|nr:cysteine desulfurase family protein [Halothece sp. Uz-M2-17]
MNAFNKNTLPIYFDYHSTTPVDPRVAEKVFYHMTTAFGNANSVDHVYGDQAKSVVKEARQNVANLVGCSTKEIIFTSGATESINIAIQGHILHDQNQSIPRIVLSPIEHKAVLDTCQTLEKKGLAELNYLQVDSKGKLNLDHLEKLCSEKLSILCVMAANNEIGNIYPIEKISQIANQYGVPLLCDASQAVGKTPIDFKQWGITYLTISGHKLYAPKGIGALVIKKGTSLEPILFGGGHERGIRSGTLSVTGIVGLGEACRLRQLEMEEDEKRIATQRDQLQQRLLENIPDLVINGDTDSRLAGNLHISLPEIPNSAVIARIHDKLAISTGAACSSGVETPSHVLRAINLPEELIEGALRIGLGKFTTEEEVDQAAMILSEAISQIKPLLAET